MPKKKTGARKKAERQKERQREIRDSRDKPITNYPCNALMVLQFATVPAVAVLYCKDSNDFAL